MAEQTPLDSVEVEDDAARHRRERRELQSTVQQLKKSVNKNDKARKKKVDAEIKALEDAFAKRWEHFSEDTTVATESNSTPAAPPSSDTPPEVRRSPRCSKSLYCFLAIGR
jgi:hypothetical protein